MNTRTALTIAILSALMLTTAACNTLQIGQADPTSTRTEVNNQTRLAGVFTDHMVLQRDQPITIWGTAPAGTQVEITFDGATQTTTTSDQAAWSTTFPAQPAGGPYKIAVNSNTDQPQTITDVLIGDVFLCSGQSNMEMKVKRVRSAPSEINRKHSPTIRQFHPRYKISPTPLSEFAEPVEWTVASKDTVGEFSAACYFFAKERQATSPVAIGMLHSSWGGSQIEAWLSQPHLRTVDDYAESLDILNIYADNKTAGIAALGQQWQQWYTSKTGGQTPWLNTPETDTGWTAVPRLTGWKKYGDPALSKFDGLVWYRNSFTLTEAQAAKGAEIVLGKLSRGDIVWINGHFIGRNAGWEIRSYQAAADLLQPGTNHILINVRSMWGDGGMMGPAEKIGVTPKDSEMIALPEGWEYKKEPSGARMTPLIPWATMAGYTGMHNGMIAPLDGLKFKAAIWYQGESNTRRAEQYGRLFTGLIKNWREMFGADMPVLIVQLPEFGTSPTEPTRSDWANLREAQRQAALRDPKVGLVVTMGLGNPADIHPTNKQDVGKRIAGVYRGLIGETNASTSGYSPLRAYRLGSITRVELSAPSGGLVTRSADHPIALELCTGAPLRCEYAAAKLENNVMVLTNDKISNPTHVRYCWGNSPTCNLYDTDGLPVGPFQMTIQR